MPSLEEVGVHLKARDDLTKTLQQARRDAAAMARELRDMGGPTTNRGLSDLSSNVGGLTRNVQSLGGSVMHVSTSLGGMVAHGIRNTALGLGALAATATGFGLKSAGAFEQSRIAMGTLLEDVAAGDQLFSRLQASNLKTPFGLEDLTGATQTLLNFGVAGDSVLKTVTSLGDLASTAQDPKGALQAISFAYGQINQSARVNAQDLNQLVQAGIPAYKVLAESVGQTTAEVKKGLDTGVDYAPAAFLDRLTNLQGVLAVRQGAAEKQSLTLLGQASNFRDTLNTQLSAGTQPLADDLRNNMPEISAAVGTLISTVMPPLSELFGNVLARAPGVLTAVGPPLTRLVDEIDQLATGEGGENATKLFVSLVGLLPDMVHLVGELVPVFNAVIVGFDHLANMPGGPEVLLGLFAVSKLAPAVSLVGNLATNVGGLTRALWGLNAAQQATAASGGIGGIAGPGGAATGRGAMVARGLAGATAVGGGGFIGFGGLSDVVNDGVSFGGAAKTIGGAALAGGAIGSVVPVVGTAVGAGVGAAAGALGVGAAAAGHQIVRHFTTNVQPGAVVVHNPSSTTDVAAGVAEGIRQAQDEQVRRGG